MSKRIGAESMMWVWVALGGAIGAVLRYGVALLTARWWGDTLPWGTLSVNVIGSFVIGFLWQWFERGELAPAARTFIFIGLLGAFTTFSSFTLDSLRLWQTGRLGTAVAYVVGSNGVGLTAVLLGTFLARQLSR